MFGFSFDKRTLYIILAIIIIRGFIPYLSNTDMLLTLLLTIPGLLVAITFHEFAHAYAADKLGDDTPRKQGRLSLNPFSHLDPVGCIMLLFAGFGWGKPVEIDPRNFKRDISMTKGEAIVSIAGPLMNFFLAIIFAFIYFFIIRFNIDFFMTKAGGVAETVISNAIFINIGLGVFNLIPLPPLDGSKVLKNFLPYNARIWFENHTMVFYIVFIVLWISGLAGEIITPAIGWVSSGIMNLMATIFGL